MRTKFILKIEGNIVRYMARNIKQGGMIVPFAFISCDMSNKSIAIFDTKDEAMAAFAEAQEYEGGLPSPVIQEIVVE